MLSRTRKVRRGFTLVELLVAVVLIDMALLAMVAGTAVVVKQHNDLRIRGAAQRLAANRIQELSAGRCASSAGDSVSGTLRETWSSQLLPNRVRELSDSVAFVLAGEHRNIVLRTRIPC